jgi:putative transposase
VTLRARKFRLYPTPDQANFLERHFGCCRKVYNHFIEVREKAYKTTGKSPSTLACVKQLVPFKKQFPFLEEMNSQALQQAVLNLGKAYARFFKKMGGYPTFKSKHDGHQSFSVPQHFELAGNKVFIPKLETGIPMVQHRALGGTPKSLTISRTPTGKYFVSVLCEVAAKPLPTTDAVVGVDVGVSRLAVTSDGGVIQNPKFMQRSLRALARAQRSLCRKRKGGKNRAKAKMKVAKLHEHVAAQRADYLHKVSRRLVDENQVICLEDLSIAGMLRNHCLARVIQDAGLGELERQVLYKSEDGARTVTRSSRWFASSKICHVCGCVNHDLQLSDRMWTCPECGTVHARDFNASQNLKQDGIAGLCENQASVKVPKRLPSPYRRRTVGLGESHAARDGLMLDPSLKQEAIRVAAHGYGC